MGGLEETIISVSITLAVSAATAAYTLGKWTQKLEALDGVTTKFDEIADKLAQMSVHSSRIKSLEDEQKYIRHELPKSIGGLKSRVDSLEMWRNKKG